MNVNGVSLSPEEPGEVKWAPVSESGGTRQLAVTLPPDLSPGDFAVRVVSTTGSGDPLTLNLTSALPLAPPVPGAHQFVPQLGCPLCFPINTEYGDLRPSTSPNWWYGVPGQLCNESGTLRTREYYFPDERPANLPADTRWPPTDSYFAGELTEFAARHDFDFSYDLEENLVLATIDRTPSGGQVEEYVGGFGPIHPCSGTQAQLGSEWMILQSVSTGRQLQIQYGTCDQCAACTSRPRESYVGLPLAQTELCMGASAALGCYDDTSTTLDFDTASLRVNRPFDGAPVGGLEGELDFMLLGQRYLTSCDVTIEESLWVFWDYPSDTTYRVRGSATCASPITSSTGADLQLVGPIRFTSEIVQADEGSACSP